MKRKTLKSTGPASSYNRLIRLSAGRSALAYRAIGQGLCCPFEHGAQLVFLRYLCFL